MTSGSLSAKIAAATAVVSKPAVTRAKQAAANAAEAAASLRAAARAAADDAKRQAQLIIGDSVSAALQQQLAAAAAAKNATEVRLYAAADAADAALNGLAASLQEKLNATAGRVDRALDASFGAAQLGSQAVNGGLYELADALLLRPAAAPADAAPARSAGLGFCFPPWRGAGWELPQVSCPQGFEFAPVGKCVRREYKKVEACFNGPVCMAPYKAAGPAECFEDKVMEVGWSRRRVGPVLDGFA